MGEDEILAHRKAYLSIPEYSSPDDRMPLEQVTPAELDRILAAARGIGGSPAYIKVRIEYRGWWVPELAYKVLVRWRSMAQVYRYIRKVNIPERGKIPRLDYIEVLWPTGERKVTLSNPDMAPVAGGRSRQVRKGVMLTIAKEQDDYFVVGAMAYDDMEDDYNRQPKPRSQEYYRCDQLRGVVSLMGYLRDNM